MPLPRLPSRRPVLLLTGLLAAAVAFAIVRSGDEPSPAAVGPDAEAVLVVDGVDFDIELDTCFIGNDSFVVAGHGQRAGEAFRVAASPSEVEVAFGVTDETAPVPADGLWLGTNDAVSWSLVGTGVTASATLAERLGDSTAEHAAELWIDCGVVS